MFRLVLLVFLLKREDASLKSGVKRGSSDLGVVIATRRLRLGSTKRFATVKIGKPRRARQDEWMCPYCIEGLGTKTIQYAIGSDAIQALFICFEAIRTRLESCGREVTWESGERGDAGFPRFAPTLYGLRFYKRVERLMDREIERFARKAEETYRRKEL